MKKSAIKVLTVVLAILLLATTGVLASCVDNTTPPDDTTKNAGVVPDSSGDDTTPVFPTADYKGKEFVVFSRNPDAVSYAALYIDTDAATDTMSSAVYTRNTNTEEFYKITITQLTAPDFKNDVKNAISGGGQFPYDVLLHGRNNMAVLCQENYLYDFNELGLDFTKPWWDVNCAEGFEVAGKLFFMANDTSVSNLAGVRCAFFNKNLVSRFKLTSPHDYVRNNDWTIENFLSLVEACREDNGDGVLNWEDVYGACDDEGGSGADVVALIIGSGMRYSVSNADGELEFAIDVERIDDIISKVATVYQNKQSTTTYGKVSDGADTSGYANIYNYCRGLFASDHFLFILNNMGVINQFSEMEGEGFGIVPVPKYNKDQDRYYNKIDKNSNIWAIPNATSLDFDCVANVMDYWAYQSSTTVMPAYYEITLKTRRVADPFDAEMLDVIKASTMYDFVDVSDIKIATAIWSGYTNGSFSSQWKAQKIVLGKSLGKLNDTLATLQ